MKDGASNVSTWQTTLPPSIIFSLNKQIKDLTLPSLPFTQTNLVTGVLLRGIFFSIFSEEILENNPWEQDFDGKTCFDQFYEKTESELAPN